MDDVSVIEKQLTSDFANLIAGIVSSMVTLIVLSFTIGKCQPYYF